MARIPTIDKRKNKDDELGPAAKVATSTLKPREGAAHVVPPKAELAKPKGPPLAFEVRDAPEASTTVTVTSTKLAPASTPTEATTSQIAAMSAAETALLDAAPVMLDLWCGACGSGLWQVGEKIECRNKSCPFVASAKPGETPTGLNLDGAISFLLEQARPPQFLTAERLADLLGHLSNTLDVDNDVIVQQPAWLIFEQQQQRAAKAADEATKPAESVDAQVEQNRALGDAIAASYQEGSTWRKTYEPPAVVESRSDSILNQLCAVCGNTRSCGGSPSAEAVWGDAPCPRCNELAWLDLPGDLFTRLGGLRQMQAARADGAKTWPGLLSAATAGSPPTALTQAEVRELFDRIAELRATLEKVSTPDPIPMLLWCPTCGARHFDTGEFATKPHHTHACQSCGMTWRPAIVPTCGVRFLPGFKQG